MALRRRTGERFTANIWPGFVDAMTALLLVLMFVLTIFMVMQFVLQETITGQDRRLEELSVELSSLAEALGIEQRLTADLEDNVSQLSGELDQSQDLAATRALMIASLEAQVSDAQGRISSFEDQVASLLAQNSDLDAALIASRTQADTLTDQVADQQDRLTASADEIARLRDANAQEISRADALQLALAQARDEIDEQVEAARLAAAEREALEALIADLQTTTATQESDLAALAAALAREEEARNTVATELAQSETRLVALTDDLEAEEAARLREQAAIAQLQERLAGVETSLSDEETARLAEAAAAERLRERLRTSDAELTAMTLSLEQARQEAEDTLTLLAAAEQARTLTEQARADGLSELERQQGLLQQANRLLTEERTATTEARRELALLNTQTATLRRQLSQLQSLLDEATARDEENQVQIEALGSQLNTALAQVAAEQRRRANALESEAEQLRAYRSEFFGRMRDLLEGQDGVRVVGDRFVFSSEVLFEPGSADLGFDGRQQITQVARVIQSIVGDIPEDINWILQVNGHTDRIPVGRASEYEDNWELSQARALSVVRYLAEVEGIEPRRLSAAGFGEFQPVDEGRSSEALARNRRIELKFTER